VNHAPDFKSKCLHAYIVYMLRVPRLKTRNRQQWVLLVSDYPKATRLVL